MLWGSVNTRMTAHETQTTNTISALSSTEKFFVLLGIILGVGLFLVDPRASVPNPGFVVTFIGIVLWGIGWLKNILATK